MMKLPRTTRRLGRVALAAIPMLGVLALSSTTTVASAATAKKSTSSSVVSSKSMSVSAQAQTLAYWTQARREAAKPVDVIAGSAPPSGASSTAAAPDGPPSAAAGSPPGGTTLESPSPTPSASQESQPVLASQPWSYPFPYDAFKVLGKSYSSYPYSVNGTIFFTNGGVGYKCSGTSVTNGHHPNEVWTAGHCVASTEEANKKFDGEAEFIPAYNGNGKTAAEIEPYGTFVAKTYTTATAWIESRDESVDFGAMALSKNERTKKTLSESVGTDGFAWNQNDNEQFVQFGYPGESPYNGTKMEENIAATAENPSIGGSGGNPTGVGSPFTGGSSGGAWNIDWTNEGPGYINGHTDFYYTEKPLTKFSPYINTLANEVRCLGKPSEC